MVGLMLSTGTRRSSMQQWNESFPDWEGARELSSLFGEDLLMDPQEILLTARVALGRAGVRLSGFQTEAGQAVATAEAVNWAAKVVTPAFYTVKETVWVAARKVAGVQGGLGHDGCFFLFAEEVGVACAHFVDDGVSDWDHPCRGVGRPGHEEARLLVAAPLWHTHPFVDPVHW
jgi:hypothetical protein